MVGWLLLGMLILDGLSYTKMNLTNMVSNYMLRKNVSSKSF